MAEQLLMSVFANYLDNSLEDNHIAVINVGGRYFEHFLYLFDSSKENTIPKKVVCITDRDPERKEKPKGSFKKCYPYEYNQNLDDFDYKTNPSADSYSKGSHQNITFFSPEVNKGKTLEYELLMSNPTSRLLLTDSINNKQELEDLMVIFETDGSTVQNLLDKLRDSDANTRIKESITLNTFLDDEEKKKSIIASRYLNSVGKGENALELSYILSKNIDKKGTDEFVEFNIPQYIKDAIEELCQ
jgi:predicted ATP-dependent endonuclease of OLD family